LEAQKGGRSMMTDEKKIMEIESLKNAENYEEAIRKIIGSIDHAIGDVETARYLLNLVICTTALGLKELAQDAIDKLYSLSLPPDWEPVRNYITAASYLDFGRYQEALELLRINLDNSILLTNGFAVERYENLARYGFALTHLERYTEALAVLNEAERVFPGGELRANIKLYQATCLGSLRRFDEAVSLSEEVASNETGGLVVEARLKIAQIRLAQDRFLDALTLYRELEELLPCSFISATDVKRGIDAALDGLMRNQKTLQ
jgi:tetratricopeptide (TPR) repeat protein